MSVFEGSHPNDDIKHLATQYLQLIPADSRDSVLLKLLAGELSSARRNRIRTIEERAEAGRRRHQRETINVFNKELFFDHPWDAPAFSQIGKQWRVHPPSRRNTLRANADPQFAAYLETLTTRTVDVSELAFASWKVNAAFETLITNVKTETVLELTRDLLGSQFSLGDGKVVLWGEATVEDHLSRIHLLLANAAGNVEAANRHKAAIQMLHKYGADTLNNVKTEVTTQ